MSETPDSPLFEFCVIGFCCETMPPCRPGGGSHGLAEERRARVALGVDFGTGKRLHVTSFNAKPVEQLLQAELRMLRMVGCDLVPAFVIEKLVEAGKHDGPGRTRRDGAHQRHGCRYRTGHAGNDDDFIRFEVRDALGFGEYQSVAPRFG